MFFIIKIIIFPVFIFCVNDDLPSCIDECYDGSVHLISYKCVDNVCSIVHHK